MSVLGEFIQRHVGSTSGWRNRETRRAKVACCFFSRVTSQFPEKVDFPVNVFLHNPAKQALESCTPGALLYKASYKTYSARHIVCLYTDISAIVCRSRFFLFYLLCGCERVLL